MQFPRRAFSRVPIEVSSVGGEIYSDELNTSGRAGGEEGSIRVAPVGAGRRGFGDDDFCKTLIFFRRDAGDCDWAEACACEAVSFPGELARGSGAIISKALAQSHFGAILPSCFA